MVNYFTDRTWMYQRRRDNKGLISEHFYNGVDVFVEFTVNNKGNEKEIRCPCSMCKLLKYLIPNMVKVHLRQYGFIPNYLLWKRHGENIAVNQE